jgi:mevalonate kinase
MQRTSSAPGKIILSGEYAVLFGKRGIAVPSPFQMVATFEENEHEQNLERVWRGIPANDRWMIYLDHIVEECVRVLKRRFRGRLELQNALPLGKGLGSSTALLVAVSKVLLGDDAEQPAHAIEDMLNPGNSGIDFAVIWRNRPVLFEKGASPDDVSIDMKFLKNAVLIDTGAPNEPTPELIEWVKSREKEVRGALDTIAACTERLVQGKSPFDVFPVHHRAQVALGVVPEKVQTLVRKIEEVEGVAKVIGAGGKTGGGGMVLALHENPALLEREALSLGYSVVR